MNKYKDLSILQVAPIAFPIGREDLGYGGTERMLYNAHKAMRKVGYSSVIACPHGSVLDSSEYVPTIFYTGTENDTDTGSLNDHFSIATKQEGFDIIHDYSQFILGTDVLPDTGIDIPVLIRLRLSSSHPKSRLVLDNFKNKKGIYFNAQSYQNAKEFSEHGVPIAGVVYNGIDMEKFTFRKNKDGYLLSIGAIKPGKGHHIAIKVAKELGTDIIIAGNVLDQKYFDKEIKPHIDGSHVSYVGELNDIEKIPFFSGASVFLMPITENYPCNGVVLESLACGTPVISSRKGGSPELIEDGKTGFIVDDIGGMVRAVRDVRNISPEDCREHVEKNFTSEIMARNYLSLYEDVMNDFFSRKEFEEKPVRSVFL